MIKTIFFDLGGVVVDLHPEIAFQRFEALGVDAKKWLDPYGQKGIFRQVETGEISEHEFLKALEEMTGREISYEEAMDAWMGFIGDVNENTLALVHRLRKNYRVCIASNTNPFVMNFMRSPAFYKNQPLDNYFDFIYCSYDLKSYKPDADFFEKILAHEGIKGEEGLFIDDSKKNIEGANAVGLRGIIY